MWLETLHSPENHQACCPTCGGGIRERVHGEMHAGSFVSNGVRVEIRAIPVAGYVDPVVLDRLTQFFQGGLYRIWPSDRYFSKGGSRLHRDAWRAAFGPIPDGCHIHHRDGNPANNRLSNLECIDAKEHLRIERNGATAHGRREFSANAREGAAAWHRSEAGREWHRRQAVRAQGWTKWVREPKECPECRNEFQALVRKSGNSQIYCNSACKAAAYRKRGLSAKWAAAHRERQADHGDG